MTNQVFTSLLIGDEAPTGSRFFDSTVVNELVTMPILEQSVAMRVSTVIRPGKGQRVEIPMIVDNGTQEPGWVAPGAEAPHAGPPSVEALVIEHYKIASQAAVPWEHMDDVSYDVTAIHGKGLVNKIVNALDRAYFDPNSTAPIHGVGRLDGINTLDAGPLSNTDAFLDAIEHAENQGTTVNHFVMSPATKTALAKLKKATGSQENLLGVNDAPGSNTIAGVPLLSTRHVEDGVIYAIPSDRMIVSMRQDVNLVLDRTAHFERMTAGLLASARLGMGSLQPEAVSKIALE